MSTPNDLQALLASIRPRPSPSSTPGHDAPMSQYPPQYHPGLRQPQHQYSQPQPYDGQSFPHPQLHQHGYHHPSVSSTMHSPSPMNTPPHHGSDILSPNVPTPRGDVYPQQQPQQPQAQNPDRAANLLNLLKFNQAGVGHQGPQHQVPMMGMEQPLSPLGQETGPEQGAPRSHARNISASDLVATLFGRQGAPASAAAPQATMPVGSHYVQPEAVGAGESSSSAAPTAENTQDMLLRLLNRPKPGQQVDVNELLRKSTSQSPSVVSPQKSPFPEKELIDDAATVGEIVEEALEEPGFDEIMPGKPDTISSQASKASMTPKESLFTYVNPFEQLAAASPRKMTPQPKSRSASPAVEITKNKKVNLATKAEPVLAESKPLDTTRSEDVKSPSLAEEQKEAVSEVVGQLVDQIGREVDQAANKQVKEEEAPLRTAQEESTKAMLSSIASHLQETAAEANDVTSPEESTKDVVPDTAIPSKEPAHNGNGDALVDSWESAEDSAVKEEERVVHVHNFPLRPFISIAVKANTGKLTTLRDDGIMDIARLKKDFDQLDRSLTSATSDYIVYALAKNGGMRIIRQDDGSDKQVFRSTRDRVFNVALCTSLTTGGSSEEQAILGIGVSGTVYWALISRAETDLFELDALESESLIFPPFPASDENTSGGQLKTRAKRSSRHPAFFAIGRGKNIYVISPQAATHPSYGVSGSQRTVNTEKFFKERALKISTGKAGKDFMFSDDDTVIASLDKTGRLRFWDIREVVNNPAFLASGPSPAEIRVPLNTFVTGSPTEKSWPTSVLFIDKLRPYVKSMALRYVLVGLKQNHTLQLWDIGLGKAVQELKFPHENESDAICSVAYHPGTGILVIGHPTRNSIYFVHLSAPRYNLQPMSQASFIKRSSEKDSSLPKPESTACMSGIREISFASKGQLRSLDLLPITKAAGDKRGLEEESGLFELYVMHSRGVTCLNIKKEDLGWSSENKTIRPVNALEEGFIEISDLQTFPSYVTDEPSVNGDTAPTPTKAAPKEVVKKTLELTADTSAGAGAGVGPSRTQSPTKPSIKKKPGEDQVEPAALATNGAEKPEKKKKKKASTATAAGPGEGATKVKEANPASFTGANEGPSSDSRTSALPKEQLNGSDATSATTPTTVQPAPQLFAGGASDFLTKHMDALQSGVSSEFNKSLGREIEGLYSRFDEERRSWDVASAAKQDQVLRLVSDTLSDNVEKNLARIVSNSIQTEVMPTLTEATSAAVSKQIDEVVSQQLGGAVPRELRQALPEAVTRAVQQPDVMKVMSDAVAQKLSSQVESEMSRALHNTITPAFKNLSLRAAEKIGADMEKQVQVQMKHYEIQRHNDSAKIDQLTTLVRSLSDTVASMAAAQTGFQNEVLRLNRVLATRQSQGSAHSSRQPSLAGAPAPVVESRTPEEVELIEITQLMREGRYEEGSVKWLQSTQQADLFDNLFVRLNPAYLTSLSPIVALSVGVAVTSSLQTNVAERLTWLEVVLQTVNPMDPDIREVAPKIMDILTQRLEALYMAIAENSPHDPILRKIPPLSRRARELRGP
ncbi:hypothetical protein ASPWEDRAFT_155743 [Aspergillus wentii DTO 134E9]|uniref:EDC4-like protein pdc1 beta-propeller domain-containing protein n=1 Tax=Aspergillus wentii DTO 134E9 TaxID=1073089 RepID=A0A1L9RL60_ASPWE|nr:uncharacterized protein ASPWEDRAFT_155743 [Aspergillus wentii DTO 134E9]OJJ35676.1 hypothetical protein ASPWEDRAFT_155743 [Aspergillus wentii DTO 134E9]